MERLNANEPLATELKEAIQRGDLPKLKQILEVNPGIATVKLTDESSSAARSLLHIATDWPGHYPRVAQIIRKLIEAGADVNARFEGAHMETPLHWAASADDVEALDALLDAGADIEANGAVIAGGTPLFDAVAFAQWRTAHRLVQRGAEVSFAHAAALGFLELIEEQSAADPPSREAINHAFWYACHGGQRRTAEYLHKMGADLNWLPPWENRTPLDAARRNNFPEVAEWLISVGARPAPPAPGLTGSS